MYLNITHEQDFNDLMLYLKEKYPKELFDLDGIGKQLDLSKFSKDFFGKSTKTTTDISVDQNSNVDDITVINYKNKSNSFLMKKTISSNSESGIHRNKSSTELHITHKSTNASTIEEKVNDYKKLLNKELVNLIEKEHTKEEERQRFFSSITDPKEKKYYTKLYEKQRAEANRQIVELNEVNERKAIMYSIKLKRETNH